jgi:hypothetical protein
MGKDDIIMEEAMDNIELTQDDAGLTLDDFGQGNFVKNPLVDQTLVFKVLKIIENKNTKGKNKETGKEFDIGLKYKDGRVRRIDIETDQGTYTIQNWEIFFKLFSTKPIGNLPEGILRTYAKANNKKFTGAKISLTRLINGGHANYALSDLSKIIGKDTAATKAYQDEVKLAMKEQRLFKVALI